MNHKIKSFLKKQAQYSFDCIYVLIKIRILN